MERSVLVRVSRPFLIPWIRSHRMRTKTKSSHSDHSFSCDSCHMISQEKMSRCWQALCLSTAEGWKEYKLCLLIWQELWQHVFSLQLHYCFILVIAVWVLRFVLIPWDLICGNKNGPWPLTKPDRSFTSHLLNDIIHQAHPSASPMMAHSFNKLGHITPSRPHHHQELFERSPVGLLLKSTGNQPRPWVKD